MIQMSHNNTICAKSLSGLDRLNAWRDTEREIITRRMQIQLQVRSLVKDLGPSIRGGFMTEMERCVPEVVLRADSKRIRRRLGRDYNAT